MNEQTFRKNRQTKRWIAVIIAMICIPSINAQVDYSARSNILNPDTLQGDQKKIFWHFVDLTHKEISNVEPLEVKAEFAKLGITTAERARFVTAFIFFDTDVIYHKKSCENIASFGDLKPKD